jgi:hypothetical protein
MASIAGSYIGKPKIREGMEACLAPVERKRIAKGTDLACLELKIDGTFVHKKTTWGVYQIVGRRILLRPREFNGASLETMKEGAENAGRSFGLAWLFDPFELFINGDTLETSSSASLIYTVYVRSA